MTYKVLADDVSIDMVIIYSGLTCKVVDVYKHNHPEIGFTLLQRGKSDPKMFHMTAKYTEQMQVSLKSLLKKL